ncbi:hypothetical protein F0562_003317 [Nyssa sinensis]|uniref:Retrotransposon gag domain-containing protein n=1 Tax=Nyssa sinensis TaxID=561372 RepID=A0A5J5BVP4_9ASTE|nr:hypothetical protein F0562_003317 [Nyssa sinensis]
MGSINAHFGYDFRIPNRNTHVRDETIRKHRIWNIGGRNPPIGNLPRNPLVENLPRITNHRRAHENFGNLEEKDFPPEDVGDYCRHHGPQDGRHGGDHQYPRHVFDEIDDVTGKVKVEAPSFDSQLDPNTFLDWLADIEDYFEWYNMTGVQRIRFTKMKLVGSAKRYWQFVQRNLEHLGRDPIFTWGKFEDLTMRCDVVEESWITVASFIDGLHFEIKRAVNLHSPESLEEAYHKALEIEKF